MFKKLDRLPESYLQEKLKYPITTVLLSIANLDQILKGGPNTNSRNFIVNDREATKVVAATELRWILDTISTMRSLKAKETYKKWFYSFMKVTMPCEAQIPQALKYVNDSYRKISSKNNARANRGEITKTCFCGEFI